MVRSFADTDSLEPDTLKRWVSKSTQNEQYFQTYDRMFGDEARFIYVVRDPRDVYTSIQKRQQIITGQNEDDRSQMRSFAISWGLQVNTALKMAEHDERVHLLRYEDLLRDPENEMKKVAEHIEVNFDDAMLSPTRHGKVWGGNSVHADGFQGISTAPIGRYREKLETYQIGTLTRYLDDQVTRLGYDNDGDGQVGMIGMFDYRLRRMLSGTRYRMKTRQIAMRGARLIT
jgi:hypothetical protein